MALTWRMNYGIVMAYAMVTPWHVSYPVHAMKRGVVKEILIDAINYSRK